MSSDDGVAGLAKGDDKLLPCPGLADLARSCNTPDIRALSAFSWRSALKKMSRGLASRTCSLARTRNELRNVGESPPCWLDDSPDESSDGVVTGSDARSAAIDCEKNFGIGREEGAGEA